VPDIPSGERQRAIDMLAQVRTETGFGPNMDDAPYVRLVAQRLGGKWGLNGKGGDPGNLSHDILAYQIDGGQPQLFDVLGDGGGQNRPIFDALPYPQSNGAVWVAPGLPPGPVEQPPVEQPPVQQPPAAIDFGPVLDELRQIRLENAANTDRIVAKLDDLQVHVMKAARDLSTAIPSILAALSGTGGLSGLFGAKRAPKTPK
jgi:hypothetical protein